MSRPRIDSGGERRHLAIVGFMGAGKSTVGRSLAARLGASFVDLDETISKKSGHTIAEIFREHGEVGFRAHERAALREVLESQNPLVIATGGGTFADPSMRAWVQAAARTVYLKAGAEVLFARIGTGSGSGTGTGSGRPVRPLLSGPDPLATLKRLLAERSPAYELAEIVVTTDRATCEEVVDEILLALKERTRAQPRRELRPAAARPELRPAAARPELRPAAARPEPFAAPPAPRGAASADRPIGLAWPSRDHGLPAGGASAYEEDPVDRAEEDTLAPGGGTLLRVHAAQGSYAVEIRAEAGAWLVDAIAAMAPGERLAVITDATVAGLHAEALIGPLRAAGKKVSIHAFTPGEGSKTLATAATLYDELLVAGLARDDTVIAVGGGVVGDVAGFVASTFLRGIAFVQVPTTTLAAVDSSVGGKTGVDTPRGKNLVGTFHAPRAVLIACSHLATQPLRQHTAGLVEAVKMAAALDDTAFEALAHDIEALLAFDPAAVSRTVSRAVSLKASVVSRDERERGERAVLNYGHTVGHAIEVGEAYRLLHGEVVGLGMLAEAAWAESEGLAQDVVEPLTGVLGGLGAPTRWREARVDAAALRLDKKRQGAAVRLPIVTRIGSYELRNVMPEELLRFVETRSG